MFTFQWQSVTAIICWLSCHGDGSVHMWCQQLLTFKRLRFRSRLKKLNRVFVERDIKANFIIIRLLLTLVRLLKAHVFNQRLFSFQRTPPEIHDTRRSSSDTWQVRTPSNVAALLEHPHPPLSLQFPASVCYFAPQVKFLTSCWATEQFFLWAGLYFLFLGIFSLFFCHTRGHRWL